MKTGMPSRSPRAIASRRSRLFADTPPAMPMLLRAEPRAASNVRSTQRLDDDALKARAEIRDVLLAAAARRRSARCSPVATGTPRSCRCRTTAVLSPEKLNSASAAARRKRPPPGRAAADCDRACVNRGRGSSTASSSPLARQPIDRRPARIAETEQPRDLVVRLARRIVARPADSRTRRARARGRGSCGRPRRRAPPPAAESRRARERSIRCGRPDDARRRSACRASPPRPSRTTTPTSSDPDEAGALRHRDRVDVRPADASASDSARSTTPQMSRTCWRDAISGHDAAPLAMDLDLRRDRRSSASATAARHRRSSRHDGRGRLVAGGLDAEDVSCDHDQA